MHPLPIGLHGTVLNKLSTGTNLHLQVVGLGEQTLGLERCTSRRNVGTARRYADPVRTCNSRLVSETFGKEKENWLDVSMVTEIGPNRGDKERDWFRE
jgi:hypothetical protein